MFNYFIVRSTIIFVCLVVPRILAIEKDYLEVKDVARGAGKPVQQLSATNNNNHHLQKRQINSLPLQTADEPQYFFDVTSDNYNTRRQFSLLRQVTTDQEERFFSSEDTTTTADPLSLFTESTTENALEQQKNAEQRRFQEEIANRAIREQQHRDLEQSQTTNTANPLKPQLQALPIDSSSILELTQSSAPFQSQFSPFVHSLPQSYSNVQVFHIAKERSRRSIDRQLSTGNEVSSAIASTVSPLVNQLLEDTNPRNDLAKIRNWLIGNLAKQLEQNIAHFADTASRSRSPKPRYAKSNSYMSTELPSNLVRFPIPARARSPSANSYTSTDLPEGLAPFHSSISKPNPASDSIDFSFQIPNKPVTPAELPFYSTAKPTQTTSFSSSTELPVNNLIPLVYSTTPKWAPEAVSTYETPTRQLPAFWNPVTVVAYEGGDSSTAVPVVNTGFPVVTWTTGPQSSATAVPKIRNVQVLPTLHPEQNLLIKPYENSVFQGYQQIYNVDQQTGTPTETVANEQLPSTSPPPLAVESSSSIASIFRSKLNALKNVEEQPTVLQKGYTNFQQSNQFFDLLQHLNSTDPQPNENGSLGNAGTAIFIRMPEQQTTTSGYIFNKAINTRNLHKKENYSTSKKSNRSAQLLKSTLVYRTPPGKRATVTLEEPKNGPAADIGLFANLLESGKPVSWLLGTPRTTTNRPFVTALLNLIQKRSSI